jgi:hypothetical protein
MAVAAFVEFGIRRADNPASRKSFRCYFAVNPVQIPNNHTARRSKRGAETIFRSWSPSGTEPTNKRSALILPAMTDDWNERLRCPKCGKTGMASLTQSDDADIPTVYSVPDGFKIVATSYGPNFHCGTCNVPVLP